MGIILWSVVYFIVWLSTAVVWGPLAATFITVAAFYLRILILDVARAPELGANASAELAREAQAPGRPHIEATDGIHVALEAAEGAEGVGGFIEFLGSLVDAKERKTGLARGPYCWQPCSD